MLEFHVLLRMVKFQRSHPANQLTVMRDEFNKSERLLQKKLRFALLATLVFHVLKLIVVIDLVLPLDVHGDDETRFRNIQLSVKIMNGFAALMWYFYFICVMWKLYRETY